MPFSISPERWRTLAPLIDRALDTPPSLRGAFIDAVTGGDAPFRTELERLVEECERADPSLDSSVPERFPSLFEEESLRPLAALGERFRVARELGRGGMATVYLARDLRHERDVAIKVLHPELAAMVGADRFLSEIRVTANLHHPHILPLFDSGEVGGTLYYVMPYIAGESLRARLDRERQLPVADALRITSEVASALDCAHRNGVIHRDIKPENILLQGYPQGGEASPAGSWQAFVVDFGISLALTRAGGARITQSGISLGTPQYMSPEQASGTQDLDARTDIYSLGAVLYEMLAGHPVFMGATHQEVLARHVLDPVPPLRSTRADLPPAVENAVARALAKAPADRFGSATEFAEALRRNAPIAIPPARRRRWPLVVSGIVSVAATAVFVAFAVSWMRAVDPPLVDQRVLVLPFENRTGVKELDALGDAAADNLARELVTARLADVVDPREAADVPAHSGGQSVPAVARHHGAGRVLRGTYYRQGDSLRFEPQIIDSRSGKPLEPLLPVVVSASGGAAAVEPLRQRVLAGFAVLGDTLFDGWAVASHPATYDAYLEFVASAHTATVDTRMQDEHLARANRLDSNFTMPLVRLSWQGNGGCRVADSIVTRLGARLDRLPVYDRAGITRNQAHCHGWRDREFKAARDVYEAAPHADGIVLQFAYAARHNNHIREALRATERLDSVRHRSDRFYWGNRIIPYHLLELYDSELIAARQLNRAVPDNWEGMAFEGRALAALGRVDELRPLLDRMEGVAFNTDQVGTPTGWMRHLGRELYVHGHSAEARLVFERVLTWFRSHSTPADPGMQEEFARALYDAGQWNEAWNAAQRALRSDTTSMAVRTLLGAIAARRGDRRTVDRIDVWLDRLTGPYLHGDNTYERARLAAILGERVHADALLKQALDEGYAVPSGVGPHDDPDFDSIRDMAAYKLLYRDKP